MKLLLLPILVWFLWTIMNLGLNALRPWKTYPSTARGPREL